MTYNPYLHLPRFAALNVLAGEDTHTSLYVIREALVYTGAYTASVWLMDGKPHSKEVDIARTMEEARPYTAQMPFSVLVAQSLVERGFDWLLQFDLSPDVDRVPLKTRPAAEQQDDSMDAQRYRAFTEAGYPVTFLGSDYRDKASLDAAIDAFIQEERRGRSS